MSILTLGALNENDTEFWLPSKEGNGLFFLDLKTSNYAQYVGNFDNCEKAGGWKIQKVISWKDKLYFFSRNSYEMWEIDRNLDIKHYEYMNQSVDMVANVELCQDTVWLVSNTLENPILCLNLNDKRCERIDWNLPAGLEKSGVTTSVQYDGVIYFATRMKDNIYLVNIDCKTKKNAFEFVERLSFINCINIFEGHLYILGRNKGGDTVLVKYGLSSKKIESEKLLHKIEPLEPTVLMNYLRMIIFDNQIFLIPGFAEKIVVYNLQSKKERVLEYPDGFHYKNRKIRQSMFFEVQQKQQDLYLFPHQAEQILKLDLKTLQFECIDVVCEKVQYDRMMAGMLQNGEVVFEGENITLDNLIKYIRTYDQKKYLKNTKYGEAVYYRLQEKGKF